MVRTVMVRIMMGATIMVGMTMDMSRANNMTVIYECGLHL